MSAEGRREHLLKIGVSGVRGVVGDFLTPALACSFAQAFGAYVGQSKVVVGRDTRASGPMLAHAVRCGLLASGCDVVDVGVLPTPTIQMYVPEIRARGGIALTASHNPSEYNALKLFNGQGLFFNTYERTELIDLYHQGDFPRASNSEIQRVTEDREKPARYHIQRVLQHVDVARIRARKFRVALDAVNGAGALMTPRFLEHELGCRLAAIHVDPEKPFPRNPEPRPDTLGELADLVVKTSADIGFAQDPDGDRLAVVDETGRVLDNDDVLALVVDAALERVSGDVVVNLTTSSLIDDVAARHGRGVHRTAVGEANVVEVMESTKAAIGGEGSNGGVIFPAVHACRDSYTAMAFLLERLERTGATVSELVAAMPHYYRRSERFTYAHGQLGPIMQELEDLFPGAELDRCDGLKVLLPEGWIHVRASNTEPILRLAVEARSQEAAEALTSRVSALFG